MSTNYFWKQKPGMVTLPTGQVEVCLDDQDPRLHIGKSYRGEHGYSFLWAQDPAEVRRVCERAADEAVVVNDHGAALSGHEFAGLMSKAKHHDVSYVGTRFG